MSILDRWDHDAGVWRARPNSASGVRAGPRAPDWESPLVRAYGLGWKGDGVGETADATVREEWKKLEGGWVRCEWSRLVKIAGKQLQIVDEPVRPEGLRVCGSPGLPAWTAGGRPESSVPQPGLPPGR